MPIFASLVRCTHSRSCSPNNAMAATTSPVRVKSLIQGRELAVPASRPPSLRELMFDAANVCTILAILFDMFALAVTLRDKNFHLAIALGQISAMYARAQELQLS